MPVQPKEVLLAGELGARLPVHNPIPPSRAAASPVRVLRDSVPSVPAQWRTVSVVRAVRAAAVARRVWGSVRWVRRARSVAVGEIRGS
ncbi:hypothetical protein HEK131_60180 [Streptomyces seoulensis]|nr:hypothetical protein HEK131_60180 [Streptomyces seoulensis]